VRSLEHLKESTLVEYSGTPQRMSDVSSTNTTYITHAVQNARLNYQRITIPKSSKWTNIINTIHLEFHMVMTDYNGLIMQYRKRDYCLLECDAM
jgi:hypothetical protein